MQTDQQARTAGEDLKKILLQLAMAYDKAMGKLNDTDAGRKQAEFINDSIEYVRKQILPKYAGRKIILYKEGRSLRSFEIEYQRLWNRALTFYIEGRRATTPQIKAFLDNPTNSSILDEFMAGLRDQVLTFTVPLLEKYEAAGEDFYLYTHDLMLNADLDATIENIADTGKTPPELETAFFGMFGLLVQAKKAEQQGNLSMAYSYLLDAGHLIGMHEGARYAMKHLPEVAAKHHAKANSAKSRGKTDKAKMRSLELFYSLRPTDENGRPQLWKSANVAMEVVWSALIAEAEAEGKTMPDIKESTLLSVCQMLHRRDKEGSSLDIRVDVVQLLPDGTEIKLPVV